MDPRPAQTVRPNARNDALTAQNEKHDESHVVSSPKSGTVLK
jgi:hypothetical protein